MATFVHESMSNWKNKQPNLGAIPLLIRRGPPIERIKHVRREIPKTHCKNAQFLLFCLKPCQVMTCCCPGFEDTGSLTLKWKFLGPQILDNNRSWTDTVSDPMRLVWRIWEFLQCENMEADQIMIAMLGSGHYLLWEGVGKNIVHYCWDGHVMSDFQNWLYDDHHTIRWSVVCTREIQGGNPIGKAPV